jgi:CRISPR-associated protein Cas2
MMAEDKTDAWWKIRQARHKRSRALQYAQFQKAQRFKAERQNATDANEKGQNLSPPQPKKQWRKHFSPEDEPFRLSPEEAEALNDEALYFNMDWDAPMNEENPYFEEANFEPHTLIEEELIEKAVQRTYLVLVCYDIANPKRLQRVAKICKMFGERVQKSVFECHLTRLKYTRLVNILNRTIDPAVDLLRFYRLAGQVNLECFGAVGKTEDEPFIII